MAGLRELRARLRSIKTTGQMAAAMRTSSTAKYFRINGIRSGFAPYDEACRHLSALLGSAALPRSCAPDEISPRDAWVILGSHRGLCGGYNSDLMRFFREEYAKEEIPPMLFVGGRRLFPYFREMGLLFEEISFSDVPTYEEGCNLSEKLCSLYTTGKVNEIHVIYPAFRNMLIQLPVHKTLLPPEAAPESGGSDLLILPNAEVLADRLSDYNLDTAVYRILLDAAAGAQAATLTAMRSACDNAEEAAQKLELTINRRRQAEVTAGVIETVSGIRGQGEEI